MCTADKKTLARTGKCRRNRHVLYHKIKMKSRKELPPNEFSQHKDTHEKLLAGTISIAVFLKTICRKWELPLLYKPNT